MLIAAEQILILVIFELDLVFVLLNFLKLFLELLHFQNQCLVLFVVLSLIPAPPVELLFAYLILV